LAVLLIGGTAEAAKGKGNGTKAAPAEAKKEPPKLPAEKLEKVRDILLGDDEQGALDAAKALGLSGASNAAEPLIDLLSVGGPPARLEVAVEALGALGDVRGVDALELYAGNRSADLRRRSVKSLGAIKDDRVVPALLTALGDGAPDVRAAAADALAARKE
jgi:HEAT repeat protein